MIATRQDLRLRDRLAADSAATVGRLGLPAKQLALQIGVEDRSARRWAREGKGCPIYPATLLVYEVARSRLGQAWEVISHLKSIAYQGLMAAITPAALVERFRSLMQDESRAQGVCDALQGTFWDTGDLASLRVAALAHAARLEALAAVAGELEARGVDPRSPEFRQ